MTTAWGRCLGAVMGLALVGVAWADEAAPVRRVAPAVNAAEARVIVKFKADAAAVAASPLATALSATRASARLQARADHLGQRLGRTLQAGRAVSERTQVMRATGIDSASLAKAMQADSEVEYAVVDRRFTWLAVPNDPLYAPVAGTNPASGQWYLKTPAGAIRSSIDAATAWDSTTGTPSVVVAVLDTGVRFDHPDLAAQLLPGYDMVSGSLTVANDGDARDADASDPGDWVTQAEVNAGGTLAGCTVENSSWHGTQVSGLIAATQNNGIGLSGVAPGARVLPVRVLGKCGGYESDITAGMRWAAGIPVSGLPANPNPARVLNMSLGGEGSCGTVYAEAVRDVVAKGAVVVVAAGNTSGHALGTPANCTGVIAVAGVRHVGTKVGYSDVGPGVTLAAPAGNCENSGANDPCLYPILSSTNRGVQGPVAADASYTTGVTVLTSPVGTSFAAPLVAGTAALMLSVNPTLSPTDVASLLRSSSRTFPTSGGSAGTTTCRAPNGIDQLECYCTTSTCGAGLLNAAAAVQAAATFVAPLTVVVSPTSAQAAVGASVTVSAAGLTGAGAGAVTYAWTVLTGSTVVSLPVNATGESVSVTFIGQGSATVQLAVTDSTGRTATAVWTGTGTAAAVPTDSGGGGGGAMAPRELAALLGALLLLGLGVRRRGT